MQDFFYKSLINPYSLSIRSRAVLLAGLVATYLVMFYLFHDYGSQNGGITILAIVPVAVSGWYFGWRTGVLSGLLITLNNLLLLGLYLHPNWLGLFLYRSLPEILVVILAGVVFGHSSRLQQTYQEQLKHHKLTEQDLKTAQAGLRNLITNNADGMIITDLNGFILFTNPAAEALWGRKSGDMVGELFGTPPLNGEMTEIEILRMGGEIMYGEIRAAETEWEGKACILVSLRDITARKLAEQAEREQSALAEALRDTAAALTSTLQLDEVLERILENIGKVVPHQGVNIVLIDQDSMIIRVARGYPHKTSLTHGKHSMLGWKYQDIPGFQWMASTGKPLVIPDTKEYSGWVTYSESAYVQSYIGAPIQFKDNLLGFLNLDSATPGFYKQSYADRLQAFVDQAATAIENARLYATLQQLAVTDELTQVYNRHGLFEFGQREFDRSVRFQRPLSAIMFDIDYFKQVNDTFGHPVGDQVLRQLAERSQNLIREVDILGRYGGEEFIILLVENDLEESTQVAERLRSSIAAQPFQTTAGQIMMTISLGVATLNPNCTDLPSLIQRADQALYTAKSAGRNRIVCLG